MKKFLIAIGAGTALVSGLFLSPVRTFAYQGNPAVSGPNHTEVREQAIESANLSAFKAACTVGRVCDVVDTQEELNTLRDMHLAQEKGDLAKTRELQTKLGLGLRNGTGRGLGIHRSNQ